MLSGSSLPFKEQARSQKRRGPTHEAPLVGPICPARPTPHILPWYPEWACLSFPVRGVAHFLALRVSQASILTAAAAKLCFDQQR